MLHYRQSRHVLKTNSCGALRSGLESERGRVSPSEATGQADRRMTVHQLTHGSPQSGDQCLHLTVACDKSIRLRLTAKQGARTTPFPAI